ncbi:MAG TPA: hypothetical protein PKD83_08595 [Ignavibacteria bacterium]|nr:hypothetical protein [Ignavibacteria bacterium]
MKPFLNKVFAFTVFTLVVSVILYLLISSLYLHRINNLRVRENANILVLGDSQPQCAVNDSVYINLENFSQNSEHFFLTYNILQLIVKNNPQINTFILGCSFHNISAFSERYIFYKNNYKDNFPELVIPRYFPVIDFGSKMFLIENNLEGVVKSFKESVNYMIKSFTRPYKEYHDYPFIGRYYASRKRVFNDSTVKASVDWHFYKDSAATELEDFSMLQEEYLKKIVSFCKEKNIKLILLNTPVYEGYYKQIPEKFISGYYNFMNELEDSNKVILYDYSKFQVPDDYYGDGNHLNLKGALMLTPVIMERLKE